MSTGRAVTGTVLEFVGIFNYPSLTGAAVFSGLYLGLMGANAMQPCLDSQLTQPAGTAVSEPPQW